MSSNQNLENKYYQVHLCMSEVTLYSGVVFGQWDLEVF